MGSRLWLYITQYEEKNNLLANLAEFIGSLKNIKKKKKTLFSNAVFYLEASHGSV